MVADDQYWRLNYKYFGINRKQFVLSLFYIFDDNLRTEWAQKLDADRLVFIFLDLLHCGIMNYFLANCGLKAEYYHKEL